MKFFIRNIYVFVKLYSLTLTLIVIIYNSTMTPQENDVNKQLEISDDVNENFKKSNEFGNHDDWLHVGEEVYVYSAYWENRTEIPASPFVRILGIMPTWLVEDDNGISCILWFDNSPEIKTPAKIMFMMDHHNRPLKPAFLMCKPPSGGRRSSNTNNEEPIPYAVSVSVDIIEMRRNYWRPNPVTIREIPRINDWKKFRNTTAACIKPMYGPYDDTMALAEFISHYRMQGIQKFIMFRAGLGMNVWIFLMKLINELKMDIDILPWNLWKYGNVVHDNAGSVSINDCLYRYMNRYENILVIDIDEFVAPKNPKLKLVDILAHKERHLTSVVSSFMFINRFYCEEYRANGAEKWKGIRLKTQRYTSYSRGIWASGDRSKYVMRPSMVIEAGYHQIWLALTDTKVVTINNNMACLHHYRKCRHIRHTNKKRIKKFVLTERGVNESYMIAFRDKLLNSNVISLLLGDEIKTK